MSVKLIFIFLHCRIVDSQTAENCKSLKNGNLTISKLNAIRMNVDKDSDDMFLCIFYWHT